MQHRHKFLKGMGRMANCPYHFVFFPHAFFCFITWLQTYLCYTRAVKMFMQLEHCVTYATAKAISCLFSNLHRGFGIKLIIFHCCHFLLEIINLPLPGTASIHIAVFLHDDNIRSRSLSPTAQLHGILFPVHLPFQR